MKIVFDTTEKAYLDPRITALVKIANRSDDYKIQRIVNKLRYKFSPSAFYVNLNSNERELVRDILNYRLEAFSDTELVGEEQGIIASILDKLEGKAHEAKSESR